MMPLLDAVTSLPAHPRRILVAGTSGAGKTTVARHVAALLDIPHIEIDALFHGPGWTPRDTFKSEVHRFSAGSCWVTEWQYSQVRAILAQRADLLVWLDLPRALVMSQVIRRTVRRWLSRQVLWNGNPRTTTVDDFNGPGTHHPLGLVDPPQDRDEGGSAARGVSGTRGRTPD